MGNPPVSEVLAKVTGIVRDPAFMTQCKEFVEKHCDVFTEDLENKLEYTPIQNEYMEVVESHIETSLLKEMGPDFDMAAFMEDLTEHISSAKEEDKSMADTIEFLTSFGDFDAFKDMMLLAKRDKNSAKGGSGLENAPAGVAVASSEQQIIADSHELTKELVESSDPDCWKTVTDKPWIKCERRQKAGSPDFARITVTLDLPFDDAVHMTCSYNMERNNWDDFMTNCTPVEEINGTADQVTDITFRFHPMVPAQIKTSRVFQTPDFPNKGDHTYMYLEWDKEKKAFLKESNPNSAIGCGTLRPDPKDPKNKTLYTSTHQNGNGMIPSFLMNWMLTSMMPKMMTKMELKYKKYKGIS